MSAAEEEVRELTTVESGTLAILNASEIDQQITTAHKYPRSVKRFLDECRELATLTEGVANECIYALPRDGKTIEGPSARLAEIVAHSWGNCRAGARVVGEDANFVTAQGVFHDLERNVAITYEVKRRITDKRGRRFKPDMIGVTANAACSIALRNAVFKGVPKALWSQIYGDVRRVVMGDVKTLANRRVDALAYLQKLGVTEEMVCHTLGVAGVEDIGLEELVVLRGLATAIREGETTPEQAFATPGTQEGVGRGTAGLKEQLAKAAEEDSPEPTPAPANAPPEPEPPQEEAEEAEAPPMSADELIAMLKAVETVESIEEVEDLMRELKAPERNRVKSAAADARRRLGVE